MTHRQLDMDIISKKIINVQIIVEIIITIFQIDKHIFVHQDKVVQMLK